MAKPPLAYQRWINGFRWLLRNAEQLSATVRGCDEALWYTLDLYHSGSSAVRINERRAKGRRQQTHLIQNIFTQIVG
jgi:hypothetical protein